MKHTTLRRESSLFYIPNGSMKTQGNFPPVRLLRSHSFLSQIIPIFQFTIIFLFNFIYIPFFSLPIFLFLSIMYISTLIVLLFLCILDVLYNRINHNLIHGIFHPSYHLSPYMGLCDCINRMAKRFFWGWQGHLTVEIKYKHFNPP